MMSSLEQKSKSLEVEKRVRERNKTKRWSSAVSAL